MMDRRAAEGEPYVFIGLPSAITGPVRRRGAAGLQRAARLGVGAGRGDRAARPSGSSRAQALDHVAGYTIVNDLTTRDLVFRRDMPEIGTDWFRAKNAPGLPADRAVPRARRPSSATRPAADHAAAQRRGDAGRVDARTCSSTSRPWSSAPPRRPRGCCPATWCSPAARRATACTTAGCCAPATSMEGTITGPGVHLGTQRIRCVADESDRGGRRVTGAGPHRPRGRDRPRGQRLLQRRALGRRRRARHAELPGRRQAPARVRALVRRGAAFSLSQRFDMDGPQKGWRRRTNPVHTMLDTGLDAERGVAGLPARDRRRRRRDLHAAAVLDAVGRARAHLRPRHGLQRPPGRRRRHEPGRPASPGSRPSPGVIAGRGVLLDVGRVFGERRARHRWRAPGRLRDHRRAPRGDDRRAGTDVRGRARRPRPGPHRAATPGPGGRAGATTPAAPAPGLSFTTAGWLHDTRDRRDRHGHLGFRGAPQRVRRRVPAAAPGVHPAPRPVHRRDVGPRRPRRRLRRRTASTSSGSPQRRCPSPAPSAPPSTRSPSSDTHADSSRHPLPGSPS